MLNTVPRGNAQATGYCPRCFEYIRKIDRLEEENTRLKSEVARLRKKNEQGYFGASTPSSQKPFKANTSPKETKRQGGGRNGHPGHGRRSFHREEADETNLIKLPERCGHCGGILIKKGSIERSELDIEPIKIKKIMHICEQGYCQRCGKWTTAKPALLSRSFYGNHLQAYVMNLHYVYGVTVGKIARMLGGEVTTANLHGIFKRLGRIWESAIDPIIADYRKEHVKHADETGWRTDGQNGYTWLFASKRCSIFRFGESRSGKIARDVCGSRKLPGYLVVDRYGGYNKIPCRIQYCFAHLLRMVQEYGEKYPAKTEVQNFTKALAPLLAEAISLRGKTISNGKYYEKAGKLKKAIIDIINHPAKDFGIQSIQTTFKDNSNRLYHWVKDRHVPADNNFAEREIRDVVISRKVSFGSQSIQGAKTRSILMSLLYTAQKRLKKITLEEWLKKSLDTIAANPDTNKYELLSARGS